jgi:hypothetical protein
MGQNVESGDIVDGDDRPLTEREKWVLSKGEVPTSLLKGGNGSYVPFDQLDTATLQQYQAKALETRRRNAAAKKLMEQAAYLEAHKEHAATILGARLAMIEGLLSEMTNSKGQPDTRLLDEKRLKVLQTALNDFDKGMGMQPSKGSDADPVRVNVTHTVAKIIGELGG